MKILGGIFGVLYYRFIPSLLSHVSIFRTFLILEIFDLWQIHCCTYLTLEKVFYIKKKKKKCYVTITTILQINWNFVNESLPIHLGTSKTKAYMINGMRTVYIFLYLLYVRFVRNQSPVNIMTSFIYFYVIKFRRKVKKEESSIFNSIKMSKF